MNKHLNIFNTYTKKERVNQLENDLTRALAICMQEDALFFNSVLDSLMGDELYDKLFSDIESSNEITINIQMNTNEIINFEQLYAVSLSEHVMSEEHFWAQNYEELYDPICDLVIKINGIVIIIEAKRDNVDCTAQLYNQIFNVCKKNEIQDEDIKALVTPVDLNWMKLMGIAVKVHSFEMATSVPNRFLKDFIDLVKEHNFRWLPEPSISSVSQDNTNAIHRRIESAMSELCKHGNYKKLGYNDRFGLWFDAPWAQELLFNVDNKTGDLNVTCYPGNTKAQGGHLFHKEPCFNSEIQILGTSYAASIGHHIKFTSWQKYFGGLWFSEDDLEVNLYTKANFWNYTGRNKRGQHWDDLATLFDKSFIPGYDWRSYSHWDEKIIGSDKSQIDVSFGYEVNIVIPFKTLQNIDHNKSDLTGLTRLFVAIYSGLKKDLIA